MALSLLTNSDFHGAISTVNAIRGPVGSLVNRRSRSHELVVLSCYMRARAVEELVRVLARDVWLRRVRVAFDYGDLVAQGASAVAAELETLATRLKKKGITFEWKPLRPRSGALVHAKGFSVVHAPGGEVRHGVLLVGSPNATLPGLSIAAASNIELGYVSEKRREVVSFMRLFEELWKHDTVDPTARIERDQRELFEFALLATGRFLSKWSGNLRSQFCVRIPLNEHGRRAVELKDPGLRRRGIGTEQDSFTKLYLRIPAEAKRAFPRDFSRDYTLETQLGRWCPGSVWRVVEECLEREDKAFLIAVRDAVSDRHLDEAKAALKDDLKYLHGRHLVDVEPDFPERWVSRMRELRGNPERLVRIRRVFSEFRLPYRREDVAEVREVFESLRLSVRQLRRATVVRDRVDSAIRTVSLEALELAAEEKEALKRSFSRVGS